MKKKYLIIYDYTHGGAAMIIQSSSKERVYEIFGNSRYYEIVDKNIESHPAFLTLSGKLAEFDIEDLPPGLAPEKYTYKD